MEDVLAKRIEIIEGQISHIVAKLDEMREEQIEIRTDIKWVLKSIENGNGKNKGRVLLGGGMIGAGISQLIERILLKL